MSASPRSCRYCASPPRQGWSGPTTARRRVDAGTPASALARDRPRLDAARLELERHDLPAELLERGRHAVTAVEPREEQEVAAAARAGHLAAERARAARDRVELVDVRRRDALGELLLVHPRLVQQLAEAVDLPEQERALHLDGLELQGVQPVDRAFPAARVAERLPVDDLRALACLPHVAEEQAVLELLERLAPEPQRRHDRARLAELDVVEAAERRGVLVLASARHRKKHSRGGARAG